MWPSIANLDRRDLLSTFTIKSNRISKDFTLQCSSELSFTRPLQWNNTFHIYYDVQIIYIEQNLILFVKIIPPFLIGSNPSSNSDPQPWWITFSSTCKHCKYSSHHTQSLPIIANYFKWISYLNCCELLRCPKPHTWYM